MSARNRMAVRVRIALLLCAVSLTGAESVSLMGTAAAASGAGAPAAPNASLVTAEVLQLEMVDSTTLKISPPQSLTRLRLRILSIRDVGEELNVLRGQEGRVLEVISKGALDSTLLGRAISGIVTYRADERGGLYWIRDVRPGPGG